MTARRLMGLAGAGSLILLAGAFAFQAAGFAPCMVCLWQRWPHAVAAALGLVALAVPSRGVALAGTAAALTTAGLGIYHTGVERGWWAGPSSCAGGGDLSGLSGSDLLSTEMAAPVVRCTDVVWSLAGLSMASWNAVLSILLAGIWIAAARRIRA